MFIKEAFIHFAIYSISIKINPGTRKTYQMDKCAKKIICIPAVALHCVNWIKKKMLYDLLIFIMAFPINTQIDKQQHQIKINKNACGTYFFMFGAILIASHVFFVCFWYFNFIFIYVFTLFQPSWYLYFYPKIAKV